MQLISFFLAFSEGVRSGRRQRKRERRLEHAITLKINDWECGKHLLSPQWRVICTLSLTLSLSLWIRLKFGFRIVEPNGRGATHKTSNQWPTSITRQSVWKIHDHWWSVIACGCSIHHWLHQLQPLQPCLLLSRSSCNCLAYCPKRIASHTHTAIVSNSSSISLEPGNSLAAKTGGKSWKKTAKKKKKKMITFQREWKMYNTPL